MQTGAEQAMKQAQNPLATEKISKLIIKFAVPAVISMLVNALYNMVDQIFIGQKFQMLGMAATNIAFPLTTISTALALLLGVGSASNFNLSLGAGEKEKAAKFAGNGVFLMMVCGTALGVVVLLLVEPLLYAFGGTPQIMPYAIPYTTIISIGIPFLVFSTGASNLIRADGSPNYAMACILSGAIFNLIFDPIFIFALDMGIEGIALATTLGQVLSSLVAAVYLLRKFKSVPLHLAQLRPSAAYARRISSLGAAACFNQLAMTVVQVALNNILRHYGALSDYGSEIPLAVVGAASKINFIYMAFAIGIAQGCQPINGFNYGARNYARVQKTYKTAIAAVTVISVLAFLCFQLFPRQIMLIFGQVDPAYAELYYSFAIRYFRIFLLMTFMNGVHPVTSNFFTSIGKATRGILLSLTRQIIFLLPLVLLFPLFFGIDGVMYAGPIADGAAAVLALVLAGRELRLMSEQQRLAAPNQ